MCLFAGLSPQRSPGALCHPHRSEHHQQTPPSRVNANKQGRMDPYAHRRPVTHFNSSHVNAGPCDDEASDDELRPNFASLSQWALHRSPLPKFPCPQHTIAEERRAARCVGRATRVTAVGSVLPGGQLEQREAAWQRSAPEGILWTSNSRERWGNW